MNAASRSLPNFIKDITLIPENNTIAELVEVYFGFLEIPERAKVDCFHMAVCVDAFNISVSCLAIVFSETW